MGDVSWFLSMQSLPSNIANSSMRSYHRLHLPDAMYLRTCDQDAKIIAVLRTLVVRDVMVHGDGGKANVLDGQ